MIMYFAIFLAIVLFFASTSSGKKEQAYESVDVAIYVEDLADSELSEALISFLDKNLVIKKLNPKNADDELFYGNISAIITIPADFDAVGKIEYKAAPQSMHGMIVTQRINQFINKVAIYEAAGYERSEAIRNANEDLALKARVSVAQGESRETNGANWYFNFANYPIMTQIILMISTIMTIYKDAMISRRNEISPIKASSQRMQLILGHLTIGIIIWAVYIAVFVWMWGVKTNTGAGFMFLNTFVFMISAVTMAMFLSGRIKNEGALVAITNVIALGSSFLSGAFIPQELLSRGALLIGHIFPSYYFVRNNDMLASGGGFVEIGRNLAVMLGFSIAFILLMNVKFPQIFDKSR